MGRESHATSTVRRRLRWLAPLLILVLLVGVGAAGWRLGWTAEWLDRTPLVAPAEPDPWETPGPIPTLVAAPARAQGADPAKVAAALAGPLADPDLGSHVLAEVAPAEGGAPLLTRGRGTATPASLTKLLTATAALDLLGPEHAFTTRVVSDGQGGIVLVGGGDPLLAARPAPDAYPARADLQTLAAKTAAALRRAGTTKVRLRYDATLFRGPMTNPDWPATFVAEDIVSPIAALWVDQARHDGVRDQDPALDAAVQFAGQLRKLGVRVIAPPTPGTAPVSNPGASAGGVDVAVESAPLREIVDYVLEWSDNDGAEVLARHVGAAQGDPTFTGATAAILRRVAALDVPTAGVVLHDGSGLSRANLVSPAALTRVLQVAAARPELSAVLSGLPVAGFTGSLLDRFDVGASSPGLGLVRAKTGTLTGVHALAGTVVDADGTPLTVVLMADRVVPERTLAARQALDVAAAALAACHCAARG